MNILTLIFCKYHLIIVDSSPIPMSTAVALLGVIVSLFALYLNIRSQILRSLNSKLSEMAKECYRDIALDKETDDSGQPTAPSHAFFETVQNISHTVSTIIFARQYLNNCINQNFLFVLWINKRSCIDKFFIQLHTSTIDFVMDKKRHSNYIAKYIDKDIDQLYHTMEQVLYCKEWLEKTYKKLGNATPIKLQKKIDEFKRIADKDEKKRLLKELLH